MSKFKKTLKRNNKIRRAMKCNWTVSCPMITNMFEPCCGDEEIYPYIILVSPAGGENNATQSYFANYDEAVVFAKKLYKRLKHLPIHVSLELSAKDIPIKIDGVAIVMGSVDQIKYNNGRKK